MASWVWEVVERERGRGREEEGEKRRRRRAGRRRGDRGMWFGGWRLVWRVCPGKRERREKVSDGAPRCQ